MLDRGVLADVSETATLWSNLLPLYEAALAAIQGAIDAEGLTGVAGCHISHTYHAGASLYFTFGFGISSLWSTMMGRLIDICSFNAVWTMMSLLGIIALFMLFSPSQQRHAGCADARTTIYCIDFPNAKKYRARCYPSPTTRGRRCLSTAT